MPLPDGIRIRDARRGDRDSIFRLLAEEGVQVPPGDQSSTLSWAVSHPEVNVLLAVDSVDRGVGMVALSHRPQLSAGGRVATLTEIVVTRTLRRRGIGGELLERARERARILGCRRLEIAVADSAARSWLERRQFVLDGRETMVWQNPAAR